MGAYARPRCRRAVIVKKIKEADLMGAQNLAWRGDKQDGLCSRPVLTILCHGLIYKT